VTTGCGSGAGSPKDGIDVAGGMTGAGAAGAEANSGILFAGVGAGAGVGVKLLFSIKNFPYPFILMLIITKNFKKIKTFLLFAKLTKISICGIIKR